VLTTWASASRSLCRLTARASVAPRRRRVVLFSGDSTVRNLFAALCLVARAEIDGDDSEAACWAGGGDHWSAGYTASRSEWRPGTRLAGLLTRFPALSAPDGAIDVVVGAGLWLMWPVPFLKPLWRWSSFPRWASFEDDVARLLRAGPRLLSRDDTARIRGAPATARVALLTTHSQCDASFTHNWGRLVRENASAATAACADYLLTNQTKLIARDGSGGDSARSACSRGLRGRAASLDLNTRLPVVLVL